MAELSFFATEDDHEALVTLLVSEYGARFVLDGTLPSEPPLTTVASVMSALRSAKHDPRFFVVSPSWQVEALQYGYVQTTTGTTRHFVRPRNGGPSFDCLASRPRVGDEGPQLVASWLSNFTDYYSVNRPGVSIPRPAAMAAAYKTLRGIIARGGKRTDVQETQKPGPMAMRGASMAFAQGTWLRVGDWHHVPRGDA